MSQNSSFDPLSHEIENITIDDVKQTAEDFFRVVIHLPDYSQVIVLDDTLIGDGYIKQFDNTSYGYACARRWVVRLDEDDINSSQPFEELRKMYLLDISR